MPLDRYLAGDEQAVTDQQKRGMRSFVDRGSLVLPRFPVQGRLIDRQAHERHEDETNAIFSRKAAKHAKSGFLFLEPMFFWASWRALRLRENTVLWRPAKPPRANSTTEPDGASARTVRIPFVSFVCFVVESGFAVRADLLRNW